MKKLVFLLSVMMLALPAMGAVEIIVEDNGDGTATVSYDATAEMNVPRAFALNVSVDAGTIDSVTPYCEGMSGAVDPNFGNGNIGYGIFPGTVDVNYDDNYIDNPGTPVAKADDPDGPGQVPGQSIVIEMGSLYEDANAPGDIGELFTFAYTDATQVTISANSLRGGVILEGGKSTEDGTNPLSLTTGTFDLGAAECFPSGHPDYDEWEAVGKPDSWCYPRQCHGDADGQQEQVGYFSYYVAYDDLNILLNNWQSNPTSDPGLGADFSHSAEQVGYFTYRVAYDDLDILLNNWQSNPADDCLDY